MTDLLVSIIIPVYNAEKYIEETINSAINQTWANKEIIIVDDGSTDNSLRIARNFECDSVKVLSQQNKGASAARNTGLKEAKGEYIQFLDADDLLSKNKIESQINQLIELPEYLAVCGTIYFQDGTDPEKYTLKHDWYTEGSNDPIDFLIKLYGGAIIGPTYGGMITVHSWLCPRSSLPSWNEELSVDDDGEFFCRVILSSKGIVYANDAISYYRKFNTSNNLSSRKDRRSAISVLKSNDLKLSYLLANTCRPDVKLVLSRLYYESAFNFYPEHTDLAHEAEKKAKELAPGLIYNPYTNGLPLSLSKLIGWKAVLYLQYLKNYILRR